jgi:hypothetical protein
MGGDAMTDEKLTSNKQVPPDQIEKRGLVQDVIVPIAQGAAGGATGAWVTSKLSQGKNPPPDDGSEKG